LADRSAGLDAKWAARRNEVLADRAWNVTALTKPNWSETYRQGFVAGYRTGLETGSSEPPTSFWSKYFSRRRPPADEQPASAEWSAGFRQGSAMAQQSGVRALLTAPLSVAYVDQSHPKTPAPVLPMAQKPTPPVASQAAAPPQKEQVAAGRSLFGIDLPRLTLKRQHGPPVPAAPPEAIASARPPENRSPAFADNRAVIVTAHHEKSAAGPQEGKAPAAPQTTGDSRLSKSLAVPLGPRDPDIKSAAADSQQTQAPSERDAELPAEPQVTADSEANTTVTNVSFTPLSAADLRFLSVIQVLP
jgi:hypothetical protein